MQPTATTPENNTPARATAEKRYLLQAMKAAARSTSEREYLPILQYVQISSEQGDRLKITGTDLDRFTTATAPANVSASLSLCLKVADVAEWMQLLSDAPITIESDPEKGRATIRAGRSQLTVPTLPPEDFPVVPAMPADAAEIEASAAELADAINAVLPFVAKPGRFESLWSCVQFKASAGALTISATDGTAYQERTVPAKGEGAALVPAGAARELARLAKAAEVPNILYAPFIFHTNGASLHAETDEGTHFCAKCKEGQISKPREMESTGEATTDRKQLYNALKGLEKPAGKPGIVEISPAYHSDGATLLLAAYDRDTGQQTGAVELPVQLNGEEAPTAAVMLKDAAAALKGSKEENATAKYGTVEHPASHEPVPCFEIAGVRLALHPTAAQLAAERAAIRAAQEAAAASIDAEAIAAAVAQEIAGYLRSAWYHKPASIDVPELVKDAARAAISSAAASHGVETKAMPEDLREAISQRVYESLHGAGEITEAAAVTDDRARAIIGELETTRRQFARNLINDIATERTARLGSKKKFAIASTARAIASDHAESIASETSRNRAQFTNSEAGQVEGQARGILAEAYKRATEAHPEPDPAPEQITAADNPDHAAELAKEAAARLYPNRPAFFSPTGADELAELHRDANANNIRYGTGEDGELTTCTEPPARIFGVHAGFKLTAADATGPALYFIYDPARHYGVQAAAPASDAAQAAKPSKPKKEKPATAEAYINAIRNANKKEYARQYWQWLNSDPATRQKEPLKRGELSYMAAQAVQLELNKYAPAPAEKSPGQDEQSPTMQTYNRLKEAHPDYLLLLKVGDFWESFGSDAEIIARELELTITKYRQVTPMTGVPYHAAERYTAALLRQGFRVAMAEGSEVTRLLNPGQEPDPTPEPTGPAPTEEGPATPAGEPGDATTAPEPEVPASYAGYLKLLKQMTPDAARFGLDLWIYESGQAADFPHDPHPQEHQYKDVPPATFAAIRYRVNAEVRAREAGQSFQEYSAATRNSEPPRQSPREQRQQAKNSDDTATTQEGSTGPEIATEREKPKPEPSDDTPASETEPTTPGPALFDAGELPPEQPPAPKTRPRPAQPIRSAAATIGEKLAELARAAGLDPAELAGLDAPSIVRALAGATAPPEGPPEQPRDVEPEPMPTGPDSGPREPASDPEQPPGPAPRMACQCRHRDAWKCARARQLTRQVSCHCICHLVRCTGATVESLPGAHRQRPGSGTPPARDWERVGIRAEFIMRRVSFRARDGPGIYTGPWYIPFIRAPGFQKILILAA